MNDTTGPDRVAEIRTYQVGRWRWAGDYIELTPGGLPNPFVLTFYGITRDRVMRKAVDYIRGQERQRSSIRKIDIYARATTEG